MNTYVFSRVQLATRALFTLTCWCLNTYNHYAILLVWVGVLTSLFYCSLCCKCTRFPDMEWNSLPLSSEPMCLWAKSDSSNADLWCSVCLPWPVVKPYRQTEKTLTDSFYVRCVSIYNGKILLSVSYKVVYNIAICLYVFLPWQRCTHANSLNRQIQAIAV